MDNSDVSGELYGSLDTSSWIRDKNNSHNIDLYD